MGGENSTVYFDGSMRRFGTGSDLFRIIPGDIRATERFDTPDLAGIEEFIAFKESLPEGEPVPPEFVITPLFQSRPDRLALDLDSAWVSQTFSQRGRAAPFERSTETGLLVGEEFGQSGLDPETEKELPGVNASRVGAFAKLSDLFRISIEEPPEPPEPIDPEADPPDPIPRIWNDRFGHLLIFPPGTDPPLDDEAAEGSKVPVEEVEAFFGRLEHRTSGHYWMNPRRTGPMMFEDFDSNFQTKVVDVRDPEDPSMTIGVTVVDEDALLFPWFVNEMPAFESGVEMNGEMIAGYLTYNPFWRAWQVQVGIRPRLCTLINADIKTATGFLTIDDRVDDFEAFACPVISGSSGTGTGTETGTETGVEILPITCGRDGFANPPIRCSEIGPSSYQERFITLTDRYNGLLLEIDKIWCALKHLDDAFENKEDLLITGTLSSKAGLCV